jgi:hypothetical protein
MKKLLSLGIAAALMAIATAAYAYPTLYGPTGLAVTPTAAIQPMGQFNIAVDYANTDPDETIPVRVLYGIGESFEVGATYFEAEDNAWDINGKWLTPLTLGGFDWALGAVYVDMDAGSAQNLYFTGTRALTEGDDTMPALAGTIGLDYIKTDPDAANGTSKVRIMAGLDAMFANNICASLEYRTEGSGIDAEAGKTIAVRYAFTDALSGQLGFSNTFGLIAGDDMELFAGVNYAFGMGE